MWNYLPRQQCTGWKCPFIDLTCPLLVELCNKSQQEWHFEVYTLIRRKFGIVAIYALFWVKLWPRKRWSCNIFDKYHVWVRSWGWSRLTMTYSSLSVWLWSPSSSYDDQNDDHHQFFLFVFKPTQAISMWRCSELSAFWLFTRCCMRRALQHENTNINFSHIQKYHIWISSQKCSLQRGISFWNSSDQKQHNNM